MKAIANTTIRLGLINLPVQVCSGEESGTDIAFKLAGPKGDALEQRYCVKGTTELVAKDDIQRGIFEGGEFHPVDPSAIDNIKEVTKLKDLGVTDVIPLKDAEARYDRIRGKYFIQMNAKGGASPNSMKLFVDALAAEKKCMVTKWTPRSRQEMLVIRAEKVDGGHILVGYSYAFVADMREPDESVRAHLSGSYSKAEMEMAKQLLGALSATNANSLDMEVDEALPMRHMLVQDALAGKVISAPDAEEAPAAPQAALADALAQALAAAKATPAAA